jgi:2-methylcitrate dehydratase PrpD
MATISQQLAEFVAGLSLDSLPPEVVEKAHCCLLNGLGVAMAAHDSPSARLADATARDLSGESGRSTAILSGAKLAPASAAFANAVLFNSRNQSDSYHTATHFGPTVIPSALAIAETYGGSGRALLEAVIAGYEVAGAIGKDHVNVCVDRGWRGSPMFGGFGSAAAASKLLGLDAEQTANALGFAACFAAGNVECIIAKSQEAQFEMGQSSMTGVMSAQLARHGGRAAPTAIEGQAGFLNLYPRTTEFQDRITAELGRTFEIMEVTFKRYPVSMIAQAPVHLAVQVARERPFPVDAIESVLIELNPFEAEYPGKGRDGEESSNQRYTVLGVAIALVHGQLKRAVFQRRDDPAVLALMERISFIAADDVKPLCTRMTFRLAGGQEHRFEATEGPRGHFLDYDGVTGLVLSLAPETRGAEAAVRELVPAIRDIRNAGSAGRLMELAATQA